MTLPTRETDFETTSAPEPDDEGLAGWVLRGPLAILVAGLCVIELITWAPSYLTWPWWTDHDVFATAAQGWDAGVLPYRDLLGNNFPGTIYLFWILGKLFGWGKTPVFWALDVSFVAALGLAMLAWSRRRLGRFLPGLVGYACFLGYYLNLDYTQAAQRDWHGPFFAVLAIVATQAWTGGAARALSALAMAAGLLIRPQVVLLMPAVALAIDESTRKQGEPIGPTLRAWTTWGLLVIGLVALGFVPILLAGVWGDFVRGVRVASFGGSYNRITAASFAQGFGGQFLLFRVVVVVAGVLLLLGQGRSGTRRITWTWLVALGVVLFYKPLSPIPHDYLTHPLMLVWSFHAAILVGLFLEAGPMPTGVRLAGILLVVGLGMVAKPRFCNPVGSYRAIADLWRGTDPVAPPTGYVRHGGIFASGHYDWDDYRAVLEYLRRETRPTTRVANALKFVPALTGPVGRVSALPAESVAWLLVVRPADEGRFCEALERSPDAIVVWAPSEKGLKPLGRGLDELSRTIERLYEPKARFGAIEVWRRKAGGPAAE